MAKIWKEIRRDNMMNSKTKKQDVRSIFFMPFILFFLGIYSFINIESAQGLALCKYPLPGPINVPTACPLSGTYLTSCSLCNVQYNSKKQKMMQCYCSGSWTKWIIISYCPFNLGISYCSYGKFITCGPCQAMGG